MKLAGKVAAVTGGSRSIGRGIVEAFLAEGGRVALSGRDAAKGKRALEELNAGERAIFVPGDVRSSADVKRRALELGADLAGIASAATLNAFPPDPRWPQTPERISRRWMSRARTRAATA